MKLLIKGLLFIFILIAFFRCQSSPEEEKLENTQKRVIKPWTAADRQHLISQLQATRDSLAKEVEVSDQQWDFREQDERWSIAEVVEHLEVHDELFYRELLVLSELPEMNSPTDSSSRPDQKVEEYAVISGENIRKSPWFLEPKGRWCNQEDAMGAFLKVRNQMIEFIQSTQKDLRKRFTRTAQGDQQIRDLHQLVLVSIAHTKRHLIQIQKIKQHPNYPSN